MDGSSSLLTPIILGIVVLLVVLLPILYWLGIIGGKSRSKEGQTARAKVLDIEKLQTNEETGMIDVRLLLEVKPPAFAAYQVRAKRRIPASLLETALQVGQVLEVRIAFEDPSQVTIPGIDRGAEALQATNWTG